MSENTTPRTCVGITLSDGTKIGGCGDPLEPTRPVMACGRCITTHQRTSIATRAVFGDAAYRSVHVGGQAELERIRRSAERGRKASARLRRKERSK